MENDSPLIGPPSSVEQHKLGSAEFEVALPTPADQQKRGPSTLSRKGWGSKPSPDLINRYSEIKTAPPKVNYAPQKSASTPKLNSAAARPRPLRLNSNDQAQEPQIARLFKECEDAAQQFQNAGTRREHVLIKCLQKAAELYEYGQTQDREGYQQLLADHKIKVTKRTSNPFTPVVKLVFHALDQKERTTLSRYASVLRYAQDEEIAIGDFPRILTEEGGIEACAERDRGLHSSPERAAAIRKRDEYYQALQAALNPDFAAISDQFPEGLSAILVQKDERGQVRLLGIKREKVLGVQRYSPLIEET